MSQSINLQPIVKFNGDPTFNESGPFNNAALVTTEPPTQNASYAQGSSLGGIADPNDGAQCYWTWNVPNPPFNDADIISITLNIDCALGGGPPNGVVASLCGYTTDGSYAIPDNVIFQVAVSDVGFTRQTFATDITTLGNAGIPTIILGTTIIGALGQPAPPFLLTIYGIWITVVTNNIPSGLQPNPLSYLFLLPVVDNSEVFNQVLQITNAVTTDEAIPPFYSKIQYTCRSIPYPIFPGQTIVVAGFTGDAGVVFNGTKEVQAQTSATTFTIAASVTYFDQTPAPVATGTILSNAKTVYLGTFNSDNLQCEANAFYIFPILDIVEGTAPTVHRVRIRYRWLGTPFTLLCGVINQSSPGAPYTFQDINQTVIQQNNIKLQVTRTFNGIPRQAPGIQSPVGALVTDYFDVVTTGESPYVYILCRFNDGPADIVSIAVLGNEGDGEMT